MTADKAPVAVLLCSDLLFGSKVAAALTGAGCSPAICPSASEAEGALTGAELLVADLGDDAFDACALLDGWRASGALDGVRTLGYYQHVDDATRRRALEAGFDLVAPRSRLFREGAELISGLLAR